MVLHETERKGGVPEDSGCLLLVAVACLISFGVLLPYSWPFIATSVKLPICTTGKTA
jgi:hypothetical protein